MKRQTISQEEIDERQTKRHQEASKEWLALADKDDWPEEEHEARFNALLRLCCSPPPAPKAEKKPR